MEKLLQFFEFLWIQSPLVATGVLIFAAYCILHLKRDKNGKFYIYSKRYQGQKDLLAKALKEHQASDAKLLNEFKDVLLVIKAEVEDIAGDLADSTFELYKQSVFIQMLPVTDRIYAGLRYILKGGNSDVRRQTETLINEHYDSYVSVISKHPELTLQQFMYVQPEVQTNKVA